MTAPLTADQLRDYARDGFVFPIGVIGEADAADHVMRLTEIESRHGPMHYRVKPYLLFGPANALARHALLLDAVESVLGPDVLLWDSSYVIKEPGSEGYVSWHQDLTYWGLESESDDDLVTAWVALTPAVRENGCMRFVAGSHRGARYAHEDTYEQDNLLHRGQTIRAHFEESSITHVEVAPGQASLHHGWAVHASNPNRSAGRRVALTMNYVKPSVRQVVGASESATLVRGRDRYGHFRPEPECREDFAPANVAFQAAAERAKRDVYDSA